MGHARGVPAFQDSLSRCGNRRHRPECASTPHIHSPGTLFFPSILPLLLIGVGLARIPWRCPGAAPDAPADRRRLGPRPRSAPGRAARCELAFHAGRAARRRATSSRRRPRSSDGRATRPQILDQLCGGALTGRDGRVVLLLPGFEVVDQLTRRASGTCRRSTPAGTQTAALIRRAEDVAGIRRSLTFALALVLALAALLSEFARVNEPRPCKLLTRSSPLWKFSRALQVALIYLPPRQRRETTGSNSERGSAHDPKSAACGPAATRRRRCFLELRTGG
jgi:hypothetical protein